MELSVNGAVVHAATGGLDHEAGRPLAVLLHGAGMDHTVWAQQSRWLAFHGWNVLAVDLPGHGGSAGSPLPAIPALSDWLAAMLASVAAENATLIGHSMGSLIALEFASRAPALVNGLALFGAAPAMPVHDDLLAAAQSNDHEAIDMVNLWGFGYRAGIGSSPAPGVWMTGLGERILERSAPGVLHTDLAACNAYANGIAAAALIKAPTLIVAGEKDQMTPLRNARALSAAIAGSHLVVLNGAGHMMLTERPDAVREALRDHLGAATLVRR